MKEARSITKRKVARKTKKARPKKVSTKTKKDVDLAKVRKGIANLVGGKAHEMAEAVADEALKGQLAPLKYLFEVSGLYPATETTEATEATEAKPEEDTLAKILLKGLNLPVKPVITDEDDDETPTFSKTKMASGAPEPDRSGAKAMSDEADAETENDEVGAMAEAVPVE
jgi:hypothetical protein